MPSSTSATARHAIPCGARTPPRNSGDSIDKIATIKMGKMQTIRADSRA